MKPDTIAAMYADWWRHVMRSGCSEGQRREMRYSFYAGAFAIFREMTGVIGSAAVTEEEGTAVLERWNAELDAFAREVVKENPA